MNTYPHTLTVGGEQVIAVSRTVYLRRSDLKVACACGPRAYETPYAPEDLVWVSLHDLARLASPQDRLGVPIPELQLTHAALKERLRQGWEWSDLVKPLGWERVVDARRNGIEWRGVRRSIAEWAHQLKISRFGLIHRLANPRMPMAQVMHAGDFRTTNAGPRTTPTLRDTLDGAPPAPARNVDLSALPTKPTLTASGGIGGVFVHDGVAGTLTEHCRRLKVNYYTVRARLRDGVPWPEAADPKRRARSDKGMPNLRRSIHTWQPGYVPKRTRDTVQYAADNAYVGSYDPSELDLGHRPTHAPAQSPAPDPHATNTPDAPALDTFDLADLADLADPAPTTQPA